MPTEAENIQAQIDAIDAELLAGSSASARDYGIDGQSVSSSSRRSALIQQRKELRDMLIAAQGPFSKRTRGRA